MPHAPTSALLILLLAVGVWSPGPGPASATAAKSGSVSDPHVGLVERPTADDPLAAWALDRFVTAGLILPDVAIERYDTKEPCGGNTAVAIHGGVRPRVALCVSVGAPDVAVKRALLHELGHVWTDETLSERDRAAFAEHRGCASWADGPWQGRASEHAAEIIAWALMDRELSMITIPDHEPEQLAAGFRVLTGSEPGFRSP
jgi:hypothetical protein